MDKRKKNIYLTSHKFEAERNYWWTKLNGEFFLSGFPGTVEIDPNTQGVRKEKTFTIDPSISQNVVRIVGQSEYGSYMILVSALTWLLHKYTLEEDIIIGSPNLGKENNSKYNIFPIRTSINPETTLKSLLNDIKTDLTSIEEYCNIPFDVLTEYLHIDHKTDYFRVTTSMDCLHSNYLELMGDGTNFCFSLSNNHQLSCKVSYSTLEFSEEKITQIFEQFTRALSLLIGNPTVPVSELIFITDVEKDLLLNRFNNTDVEIPKDKTLIQLFEEQVEKFSAKNAVVSNMDAITYCDLNQKSQQLATYLVNLGVQHGEPVALIATRSIETIIGILGIIKAGAVYVPLNTNTGLERIKYILEDCGVNVLLTTGDSKENFDRKIINLKEDLTYQCEPKELGRNQSSEDSLYIMYTSGTTGQPKGTVISHMNVCRLLMNTNFISLSDDENILQTGSIAFDAFTFELWGALLYGGTLHFVDEEELLEASSFERALVNRKITSLFLTPPLFSQLVSQNEQLFSNIRNLVVGGDILPYKAVNTVRKYNPTINVINGYGPTENTTFSTSYLVEREFSGRIPIGKPLHNSTAYIVDLYGNLQPIGIPGEIYVGGLGVAAGYVNREELTNEKFIDSPFKFGERLYKTGDVGVWLPDGNIDYLGRKDNQVKVRGYRIEIQEVENVLLSSPLIKEAVIVTKLDNQQQKFLCAYVIGEKKNIEKETRDYLKLNLPEYMIPSVIIELDEFPLSLNGKIDKRKLPDPDHQNIVTKNLEEPDNYWEEKVASVWKKILNVNEFGTNTSFFDLGGNSLVLATLATHLRKEFNTKISMKDLFRLTTVREQANFIRDKEKISVVARELLPLPSQSYYQLSSAQKRIYMLDRIASDKGSYNIPVPMEIFGELSESRVEEAFRRVIERHEILRTTYEMVDGKPVQVVHASVDNFRLNVLEINQEDLNNTMLKSFTPFDLSKAPLLNVHLLRLSEVHHVLLLNIHHIILDGISLSVIMKEFLEIYKGGTLATLEVHYKEFADWQQKSLSSDTIKKQENYWLNTFKDSVPILELPADYQRPKEKNYKGSLYHFRLGGELKDRINAYAKELRVTLNMVLHGFFSIFISKYSMEKDVVIGIPVSARTIPQVQEMLGMFVNTLAIRTKPESNKSLPNYFNEVKETLVEALDHQDYPFEELVNKLNLSRDTSRNPLFNVMFSMQNMGIHSYESDSLRLKTIEFPYQFSKFDLTLFAHESEENIAFSFEYSTQLFKEDTIKRMADHFIALIENVLNCKDANIGEVSLIKEGEIKEILNACTPKQYLNLEGQMFVHEQFEQQVMLYPDKVAVVNTNKHLTYRELDTRANQLANYLIRTQLSGNKKVAIILENTIEIAISILGTLKAGLAFIPIDPHAPKDRINHILNECSPGVAITSIEQRTDIEGLKVIKLDSFLFESESSDKPQLPIQMEDLAYIIYTSGSTGVPKGVMIEHKSLSNYFSWFSPYANLSHHDRFLLLSSYAFDLGYTGLFSAILNGGEVHFVPKDMYQDPNRVMSYITDHKITYLKVTPSLLKVLSYADKKYWNNVTASLRLIVIGGEILKPTQIEELVLNYPSIRLINHYGPTETCIGTVAGYVNKEDLKMPSLPLGRAIANNYIYVLDDSLQLLPQGMPGQIFVGGKGLARGYYQNNDLTQESFILNPYQDNEFLYKTGDIGRITADGRVEFLGRKDNQIKIRGYRVELEEIERVIAQYEVFRNVAVKIQDQKIIAYVEVANLEHFEINNLKNRIASVLPDYMIPTYYHVMDKLPMNSNGKVDRHALPEVKVLLEEFPSDYEVNEIEERILSVWEEVLKVENINLNLNFFESGGDSLRLLEVFSKVDVMYPGILKVADLFSYPTIKTLGQYITTKKTSMGNKINKISIPSNYFEKGNALTDTYSFEYSLDGSYFENFIHASRAYKISEENLLSILWYYLLSEMTSNESIEGLVSIGTAGSAKVMLMETAKYSSIEQLIFSLKENMETAETISLEGLAFHNIGSMDQVSCLVTDYQKTTFGFDIQLTIQKQKEKINLILDFSSKLEKDKMLEILQNYNRAIQAICEKEIRVR
ncbi:non-ribosomal peptide synthetase [Lysinibacillus xylanilyticus]|uniref:Amino acid adenylation domain-containing protein n=1 Tax=Lysinibacillus xylanilyticus TaxID=582475 RepID=A0ABT4EVB3_9BACI|nr:non-ribosomal peptide synthetase [Lysinibacillus xylanilyticus]MCY9549596.1 amino acid adenylation domain-containing protein [Lysinibacillus xylanilyticus]